jgi:hypothetical protein
MGRDAAMASQSIRAGWRATLATPGILVGAALVIVVVGRGRDGVEFVVLFALLAVMSLLSTAARHLDLSSDEAVMHGIVAERSIRRSEIVSVEAGTGWRPGVTIRGTDRSLWAPVGDRFLGGASDRRLAEIRSWALAP